MENYDGQEMTIRATNRGKYQVLPANFTPADMTRAPVFDTQTEAEAYINRPMPDWVAHERSLEAERQQYTSAYAGILSRPALREMRGAIQELYGEYMWQSKLAGDAQRASVRSTGQVSVMGRDIAAVRQVGADYQADEASAARQAWSDSCHTYEVTLQQAMRDAGIPIALFRTPVLEEVKHAR